MQRVLSARSPREAAFMSGFVVVVLLIPRYMLITGLTLLALVFFSEQLNAMGSGVDFELVLPLAMREFMPHGLLGLLIAALLAAFMSTYAATVNAAPAYVVNDIYKRYIRPDASDKTYVWMSYATSIVVVIVGTGIGLYVTSLNVDRQVDRRRPLRWLHGSQPAEVDLVAVQQLRILLGHGRRHGVGWSGPPVQQLAGSARVRRPEARGHLPVPGHLGALAAGLHRRNPANPPPTTPRF